MVSATSSSPESSSSSAEKPDVKVATPDLILFDDAGVPIELMTDLIFENIGGQELLSISRNDIVNGQDVVYQPIRNLAAIQQQFNSQNLIKLPSTADDYFKNFPLDLNNYLLDETPITIDSEGNLVVTVYNAYGNEQIEVQIFTQGSVFDDTIY